MLLRLRVSSVCPSLAVSPGPPGEVPPCVLCSLMPQVNGRMQKLGMATPRAFAHVPGLAQLSEGSQHTLLCFYHICSSFFGFTGS